MSSPTDPLLTLIDAVETMDQKITPYGEREDGTILHYIVADSTWHRVLAAARHPDLYAILHPSPSSPDTEPRDTASERLSALAARMARGTDICVKGHRADKSEHIHFEGPVLSWAREIAAIRDLLGSSATVGEPTRWWGVEHTCSGIDRRYPTLHWADEPENGAGPRRAFECDACGDRYTFHGASSPPPLDKSDALRGQVNMLTEHFRRLSRDWHDRSTRPCPTCDPITRIIGEAFGCSAFRIEEAERRSRRARLSDPDTRTGEGA